MVLNGFVESADLRRLKNDMRSSQFKPVKNTQTLSVENLLPSSFKELTVGRLYIFTIVII